MEEVGTVPSVLDIAAAVLERTGPISTMKLQKLVYYSKAWHAVWEEQELFPDEIEAWANGPVCPALYRGHRGMFTISSVAGGDPSRLTRDELESIEVVVEGYNQLSGAQLSDLTHREAPWVDARREAGLAPGERGHAPITTEAMVEYYGGLRPAD